MGNAVNLLDVHVSILSTAWKEHFLLLEHASKYVRRNKSIRCV
jgi:hypothetical protein